MIDLASLVVRLVADVGRFAGDLDRARARLESFADGAAKLAKKVAVGLGAAAAGVAVGFVAMAKSAIDAADNMNDLSKSTGISTESLSQLNFAAEQSGTSLDGLADGLRKFTSNATDAATKAGAARDAFELIGVAVTDAGGQLKATDELLLDVAEKFAGFEDGAAKSALAVDLFGRSGAALIPFLNEGRAGIEALKAEADRLGLTLKTSTAKEADEFNDTLGKIKATLEGQVLRAVTALLPRLVELAKAFADLVSNKQNIDDFLFGASYVLKGTAAAAAVLATYVQDTGRAFGALAAIVVNSAKLRFKQAQDIYDNYRDDAVASEDRLTRILSLLYDERASTLIAKTKLTAEEINAIIDEAAERYAPKTKVPIAKKIVDPLQEVEIKLKKITLPEDYYKDVQEETFTGLERAFSDFNKRRGALEFLKIENQLKPGEYEARLKEMQTQLLTVLSQGPTKVEEKTKEINEYQLQAARNTQDIIADTFEGLATGADITASSILKSFGAMLVRLAAQAAAANLAGKLFGEAGGGAKGTGGLLSSVLGAFGGTRDSGGRGRAGMAYAIGTGAQPEMFIPDRPGTFVPAGMGGASVQNNFTIVAEEPVSRRTQLQIAAAAARGVARANRRNN